MWIAYTLICIYSLKYQEEFRIFIRDEIKKGGSEEMYSTEKPRPVWKSKQGHCPEKSEDNRPQDVYIKDLSCLLKVSILCHPFFI